MERFTKKVFRFENATENRINALERSQLYFSTASKFNDLFDVSVDSHSGIFRWTFDDERLQLVLATLYGAPYSPEWPIDESLLQYLYKWLASDPEFQPLDDSGFEILIPPKEEMQLKEKIGDIFSSTPICCFFESDVNNPLMWAHYANNHDGFCVEYEIRLWGLGSPWSLSRDYLSENFLILPVSYTTSKSSVTALDFLLNPFVEAQRALSTKSYHWAYEKEVRLINMRGKEGLTALPRGIIPTSIYIGSRVRESSPEMYERLTLASKNLNLDIYEMRADQFSMALKPQKI